MNVKGSAFTTARQVMIQGFGDERWNAFMTKLAEKDAFFSKMIMAVSLIPIEKLFVFFDEMSKEFFNSDKTVYELIGRSGAKFVLQEGGMYHSYLLNRDMKHFVEFALPKLWSTYYDGGVINTKLDGNIVHMTITGVNVKYIYFEHLIIGYFKQALKVFGKKSAVKKVRSIAQGDDDFYFQFELKDA